MGGNNTSGAVEIGLLNATAAVPSDDSIVEGPIERDEQPLEANHETLMRATPSCNDTDERFPEQTTSTPSSNITNEKFLDQPASTSPHRPDFQAGAELLDFEVINSTNVPQDDRPAMSCNVHTAMEKLLDEPLSDFGAFCSSIFQQVKKFVNRTSITGLIMMYGSIPLSCSQ